MVVVVASDALLDSPGRLFWPIILVESSRVESRVRLSSSMLTLLQFRHPVGEPEHGG